MSEKGCLMSRGLCSWLPVMARHKVYAQCQMCASSVLVVTGNKYINCRCCCFGHTCRSVLQVPPPVVPTFEHWNYGLWSWCSRVLGVGQLSVSDEVSRVFRNVGTLYRTVPRHISEWSCVLCLGVCWVRWGVRPDLQGLLFNSVPDRTSWVQLSKKEKSMFQTRYCWRCAYVTCETCTASESNQNDFGCQRVDFSSARRCEYLFAPTGKWQITSPKRRAV
jgi:hypothetical protein